MGLISTHLQSRWIEALSSLEPFVDCALLSKEQRVNHHQFPCLTSVFKEHIQGLIPLLRLGTRTLREIKETSSPAMQADRLALFEETITKVQTVQVELAIIHSSAAKLLRDALFSPTPPRIKVNALDRKGIIAHLYKDPDPRFVRIREILTNYNSLLKHPRRFDIYADGVRVLMKGWGPEDCREMRYLELLTSTLREENVEFMATHSLPLASTDSIPLEQRSILEELSPTFPDISLSRSPTPGQSWTEWHRENMFLLAKRACAGKQLPPGLTKKDLQVFLEAFCARKRDFSLLEESYKALTTAHREHLIPMEAIMAQITPS